MRQFVKAAVLLGSLLILPACQFVQGTIGAPSLRDVRIEGVEVVPQPESERDVWGPIPRGQPMVRAAFSTDRDLSSYQRDYAATFWINTALCQGGAPNLLQRVAAGPLRMEDGTEFLFSDGPHQRRADGRYSPYFLSIQVVTRPRQLSSDYIAVAHDLRRSNEDICFSFSGGPMWFGTPHRSANFRLPYARIADALARAGLPHAPLP